MWFFIIQIPANKNALPGLNKWYFFDISENKDNQYYVLEIYFH